MTTAPPAPIEPTLDMIIAGFECEAWDKLSTAANDKRGWPYSCKQSAECVRAIYLAMRAKEPNG